MATPGRVDAMEPAPCRGLKRPHCGVDVSVQTESDAFALTAPSAETDFVADILVTATSSCACQATKLPLIAVPSGEAVAISIIAAIRPECASGPRVFVAGGLTYEHFAYDRVNHSGTSGLRPPPSGRAEASSHHPAQLPPRHPPPYPLPAPPSRLRDGPEPPLLAPCAHHVSGGPHGWWYLLAIATGSFVCASSASEAPNTSCLPDDLVACFPLSALTRP